MLEKEVVDDPDRVKRIGDMVRLKGTLMCVNGFPFRTLDGKAYIFTSDRVVIFDHFELCNYFQSKKPEVSADPFRHKPLETT